MAIRYSYIYVLENWKLSLNGLAKVSMYMFALLYCTGVVSRDLISINMHVIVVLVDLSFACKSPVNKLFPNTILKPTAELYWKWSCYENYRFVM